MGSVRKFTLAEAKAKLAADLEISGVRHPLVLDEPQCDQFEIAVYAAREIMANKSRPATILTVETDEFGRPGRVPLAVAFALVFDDQRTAFLWNRTENGRPAVELVVYN